MAEEFPGINFSDATFESSGEEKTGDTTDEKPAPTRTRKRRSDAGVPRGSRSGTTASRKTPANKLANELLNPIGKVAMGIAFQSPTAAAVLITRGESTAQSLVNIAQKHPRMLAVLEKASQVGDASELIETMVMFIIALNMDLGRLDPNHPLASLTGVARLYQQTHPVEVMEDGSGAFTMFTPPPGFGDGPPGPNDPSHPFYSFRAGSGAATFR